ncbi:potassium channel subfamily K member 18 [Aplysia californica]|uniref:Potassium channel subfamily K member 18 n=1 Tax=Aplysia californica TaxID=6500 RepID=A0ABM1W001_APLCA|nr:potassium channel subfamily K member 18 [Aplysia californica]
MEAFRQFEQEVYRAVVEGGWDGTDDSTDLVTKWTFPGALLFSVTVITTIGYGDIVPKTRVGQAVCVVYAMIGIPLTLLCLANIGGFLANLYKLIWQASSRLWKLVVCMPKKNKESLPLDQTKVPVWVSLVTMGAYILLGAGIFSSWEKDWSFLDGSYFCFITLSTIGFGDFVPGQVGIDLWLLLLLVVVKLQSSILHIM